MLAVGKTVPLDEIVVRHTSTRVQVFAGGEPAFEGTWQAADDLCDALERHDVALNLLGFAAVRHEGARTIVAFEGKCVLDLERRISDALAVALRVKARKVEEREKAEAIAMDHAILIRAGVPLGLSNSTRIQDEASKLAAWDTALRRNMPGGVRSTEVFGTPEIIVHPPKKQEERS